MPSVTSGGGDARVAPAQDISALERAHNETFNALGSFVQRIQHVTRRVDQFSDRLYGNNPSSEDSSLSDVPEGVTNQMGYAIEILDRAVSDAEHAVTRLLD